MVTEKQAYPCWEHSQLNPPSSVNSLWVSADIPLSVYTKVCIFILICPEFSMCYTLYKCQTSHTRGYAIESILYMALSGISCCIATGLLKTVLNCSFQPGDARTIQNILKKNTIAEGKQQFSFWKLHLVSVFSVITLLFVMLIYMWCSSNNPINNHCQIICNPPTEHLISQFQMKSPVLELITFSLVLPCPTPCCLVLCFHYLLISTTPPHLSPQPHLPIHVLFTPPPPATQSALLVLTFSTQYVARLDLSPTKCAPQDIYH